MHPNEPATVTVAGPTSADRSASRPDLPTRTVEDRLRKLGALAGIAGPCCW